MGSIDEEAIRKASLQQRVTSGAILLDKRELLAGRATHRVEHTLSKDQIYETLENIYTRLAELKEIRETIEVEAEDAEISDTPDAA